MNYWKWSIGEAYYKSARKTQVNKQEFVNLEYDSTKQAINMSLNNNEGINIFSNDDELINITNTMFSRNQKNIETRREDLDNKMSDRDMISQRGVNPFLQNSYVNDVVTRDIFLKPINTTQGIHKISETEKY